MCPITLTIVGASIGAALGSIGTGAGVAGAATAAIAAGSAAASGAGLAAATGIGVAAAGASIAGAGTAAIGIGGAVGFGSAAASSLGASIGAASIATEIVALLGVAASVWQYKREEKQATQARRSARDTATIEKQGASDEANRQQRVMTEEKIANQMKGQQVKGAAQNLMNRGSMQVAALVREADRGTQQANTVIDTKLKALKADELQQRNRAFFKESEAFKANKGPSKLALGLSIGGSLISGVAGAIGGTLGSAGKIVGSAVSNLPPMLKN